MPYGVSDKELEVLKSLWKNSEATVRTIAEDIYRTCTEVEIGSVHTMIRRLERKKLVKRNRNVHPHRFTARLGQEEMAARELTAAAKKISGGSLAPLVVHLLNTKKFSRQEANEIRQMLSQYQPPKK